MRGVRTLLGRIINHLYPTETIGESKRKWNQLGERNPRYFVCTAHGENIDEDMFRETGRRDFEELIASDVLIRNAVPDFKRARLLEIGCGIGRLTEFMAEAFDEVRGIDISGSMIEEAKRRLGRYRNVKVVETDGVMFPFDNSSFDVIFSFIVFQHMPDERTIRRNLAEIDRTLKPNGIAKIQLRGVPVSKLKWYYGPAFDKEKLVKLLTGTPLTLTHAEDEGKRYFWVWLRKHL